MSQSNHASTHAVDGSRTSNVSNNPTIRVPHKFSILTNTDPKPPERYVVDIHSEGCNTTLHFQTYGSTRDIDESLIVDEHKRDMESTLAALDKKLDGLT